MPAIIFVSFGRSRADRIIGRFLCDINIMRMALFKTRAGDPDKLRALVQVDDRFASRIPHTGLDSTNQLVNGIRNGSLIRNTALNAFRNQFLF